MKRKRSESGRLLRETSSTLGLIMSVGAALCVAVPGALNSVTASVVVLVCLAVCVACDIRLLRSRSTLWPVGIAVAGLVAMVVVGTTGTAANSASTSALTLIAGGVISSVIVAVGFSRRSSALLIALAVITIGSFTAILIMTGAPVRRPITVGLVGWAFCITLALWLGRLTQQTVRRITNMGRAYHAERRASEAEARRRQDARLLHDTVLATLTLLAHSGVGVREQALREQAAEDAALLRQLRMGFTPNPSASGHYNLKQVDESTLGNTLESVKQRFRRIGLEVDWHGSGHVLLPSETLDAFLLALAECLENVRRHSGVAEAHVTITDDEGTVRAMVTDAGVGFDLAAVAPERLGFAESIVARLREVGGNARLFSSPGSGTTVVLEVPK